MLDYIVAVDVPYQEINRSLEKKSVNRIRDRYEAYKRMDATLLTEVRGCRERTNQDTEKGDKENDRRGVPRVVKGPHNQG
jgi:hypothetical protein